MSGMSGADKASMFIELGDKLHKNFNQTTDMFLLNKRRREAQAHEEDKLAQRQKEYLMNFGLAEDEQDRKRFALTHAIRQNAVNNMTGRMSGLQRRMGKDLIRAGGVR